MILQPLKKTSLTTSTSTIPTRTTKVTLINIDNKIYTKALHPQQQQHQQERQQQQEPQSTNPINCQKARTNPAQPSQHITSSDTTSTTIAVLAVAVAVIVPTKRENKGTPGALRERKIERSQPPEAHVEPQECLLSFTCLGSHAWMCLCGYVVTRLHEIHLSIEIHTLSLPHFFYSIYSL